MANLLFLITELKGYVANTLPLCYSDLWLQFCADDGIQPRVGIGKVNIFFLNINSSHIFPRKGEKKEEALSIQEWGKKKKKKDEI